MIILKLKKNIYKHPVNTEMSIPSWDEHLASRPDAIWENKNKNKNYQILIDTLNVQSPFPKYFNYNDDDNEEEDDFFFLGCCYRWATNFQR